MSLRLFHAAALAVALWQFAAAEPVPPVDGPFPSIPVPPAPPTPTPTVDPAAVPVLTEGVFYVVKSDAPFMLYASPPGLVTITKEAGPVKLRGVFIDGTGKVQTRTFNQKCLAFVEAVPGAKGRVELIYNPVGATDESKAIRRMVDVNTAPQPPPDPVDPPKPDPKVDPVPNPGGGLRVLMLFDATNVNALANGHKLTLFSVSAGSVREYLGSHCVAGPDGATKEYRVFDSKVDLSMESPFFQGAAKRPHPALPWVVVAGPKGSYEGPLPATPADALALIKKYAE